MKQYIDLCRKVLDTGISKTNRTGIDHIGYTGDMMKFDLADGFPIVTTKKLAWKSCFAEMLGFLRGYDNAEQFELLGCNFWRANADENKSWVDSPYRKGEGDLGMIYGVRWRKWRNWFPTPAAVSVKTNPVPEIKGLPSQCRLDFSSNIIGIIGNEYKSNSGGYVTVIKEHPPSSDTNCRFDIQFKNTGFVLKKILKCNLENGQVRDPYATSIYGVGVIGVPDGGLSDMLKPIWNDMIKRCYGGYSGSSEWYAEVSVCNRWLVFEYFAEDFNKIDQWELKLVFPDEYSLDKDIYGASIYSPQTCRWSSIEEQMTNTKHSKSFVATSPSGEQYIGKGASQFAKEHGLQNNLVRDCVSGRSKSHRGWRFQNCPYQVSYTITDQLKLVVSKLKLNKDDRRLIISGWHPGELQQQALPTCPSFMQFGIHGDRLNLSMYQRSADVPLGVPMNISGYAFLLSVMAHITGFNPGVLTHFIGDIHIYENQMDGIKEQIQRTPKRLPTLRINERIKTLNDLETWVTTDDFVLDGYDYHPAIKFPFSV